MPHKPLQPLASSHRADQFYLFYRITLLQIIRYDNNGRKQGRKEKGYKAHKAVGGQSDRKRIRKSRGTCRDLRFDFERLYSKMCFGAAPRRRLTDKEVEALCSLSDARGALMLIAAAVKSIQSSHRAQYFADTRFVEQWMRAAIPLIARWNEIQEYITQ